MSDIAFTTLRSAGYEGQLGDMLYAWSKDYPQDFNSNTLGGDGWTEYWRAGLGTAVPPLSPVDGDVWTALNGHSAEFDGTEWVAVNPLTNNVAEILGNSTFWIDAKASTAGEQEAVNYGLGGSVLDAQYGSTAGADTNDPLLLTHTGDNYVYFPGVASNSIVSTSNVALSGSSVTITAHVSGVPLQTLPHMVVCNGDAVSNRGFEFYVLESSGNFRWTLRYSDDGAAETFVPAANVTPADAPGDVLGVWDGWVRVTNTSGGSTVFERSEDGAAWTTIATVGGAGSIYASTTVTRLGARSNNTYNLDGSIHYVDVDTSAGTFTFDAATDITDAGATSLTATSGQTITVNRSTSGRKTTLVTRPTWLFGTDDYLQVPDNALLDFGASDDFTVMAVSRGWRTTAITDALVAKGTAFLGAAGYTLGRSSVQTYFSRVSDGTNNVASAEAAASPIGSLVSLVSIRDAGSTLNANVDGVAGPTAADTTGSLSNASGLTVGSLSGGGSYYDGELVAVAVWPRVLTTDEIAAINAYYGTS